MQSPSGHCAVGAEALRKQAQRPDPTDAEPTSQVWGPGSQPQPSAGDAEAPARCGGRHAGARAAARASEPLNVADVALALWLGAPARRISGLMTEMTAMETSLENLREQMEKAEKPKSPSSVRVVTV